VKNEPMSIARVETQPLSPDDDAAEIARIRAEYRRRGEELASDFYGWERPVNHFLFTQTARACIRSLVREGMYPLNGRKILDVGCGSGTWLLEFAQWGADPTDIAGIDLDESRISKARTRLPISDLQVGNAARQPWPNSTFDVVSQFTVFSSILSASLRERMAAELLRVVKPGGILLWYDLRVRNPANSNVRPIKAPEIRSLFPNCRIRLSRVTLAPPLARAIIPHSWTGGLALECIPLLRTHYLATIQAVK
jgi:SAM-dependent methyltransferase